VARGRPARNPTLKAARYGQLLETVYAGPLSSAGAPFWECGTVTLAVAGPALSEASVVSNVMV
jgi:hypothetical protein